MRLTYGVGFAFSEGLPSCVGGVAGSRWSGSGGTWPSVASGGMLFPWTTPLWPMLSAARTNQRVPAMLQPRPQQCFSPPSLLRRRPHAQGPSSHPGIPLNLALPAGPQLWGGVVPTPPSWSSQLCSLAPPSDTRQLPRRSCAPAVRASSRPRFWSSVVLQGLRPAHLPA